MHKWKSAFDVFMDFEGINISEDEYFSYTADVNIKELQQRAKKALTKHSHDNILFASYNTDNWQGDAFVLFERNKSLYEVNGTHCSCYDLEGQWKEEKTFVAVLAHRLMIGTLGYDDESGNDFHNELCDFLGI